MIGGYSGILFLQLPIEIPRSFNTDDDVSNTYTHPLIGFLSCVFLVQARLNKYEDPCPVSRLKPDAVPSHIIYSFQMRGLLFRGRENSIWESVINCRQVLVHNISN